MTAALLTLVAATAIVRPGPDAVLGPPLVCRVTFEQELGCVSPSGQGRLCRVQVRAAIPADDERQRVEDLVLTPAADEIVRDAHGNRIAVWKLDELRAGVTARFGWTCRATVRAIEHQLDPASLLPLDQAPADVRGRYLGGGRKYGLDDAGLIAAAKEIRQGARDALDLAFRTNEFLRQRLTYKNDSQWDDAPQCLQNGHGSCSEYGFLFLALCRLNGLPARHVGATARRADEPSYEDTVHHRWSEVYLPGHGWFPVDVSRNDGEDGAPVNRYFGKITEGLLILVKGDGADDAPLGWGYVSDVEAAESGDARLSRSKRFVWDK